MFGEGAMAKSSNLECKRLHYVCGRHGPGTELSKERTMKGGIKGWSFKLWACAAALAALPVCADAYTLLPTEAKEVRTVFGGNQDAGNFVDLISTQRVDCTYDVHTNYSGV